MQKLRFLCATHRHWLHDNPLAATSLWQHSLLRSQELAEEAEYLDAARHAGTAFETAGILLNRAPRPGATDIRRFTDSCAMLVDLLYRLEEHHSARNMTAAAISQMEQLLLRGVARKSVLAACQRLLELGMDVISPAGSDPRHAAVLH